MPRKITIFSKVIIMIVLFLIPVLVLYGYTNKVSVDVVENEIGANSLGQLSFLLQQFDATVEQLAMYTVTLSADPHVRELMERDKTVPYDRQREEYRINKKLSLQSVSSSWMNEITLYLPKQNMMLSSNLLKDYDPWGDVKRFALRKGWIYDDDPQGYAQVPGARFVRQISEPYSATSIEQVEAMFQVGFPVSNISGMMDMVKWDGRSDPFLYNKAYEPIGSTTMDAEAVREVMSELGGRELGDSGQVVADIGMGRVAIFYVKSQQLGWYLVDYVPVENILQPIHKTNAMFYATIGLLLAMGVIASYLLYRNVQRPIGKLMRGVQMLKKGNLSTRIENSSSNEFDFLFLRFNEMAEEIQDLVERVYAEKIRGHEATLKQLQAQINPHFLYNSLFFIINTAKMQDTPSVVAMAQNLAEYYRYTTRMEDRPASLREELQLVENYLEIHNLRLGRLRYELDVPEEMLELPLPRLLLQPIVENAIVHGIERKPGAGLIRIAGHAGDGRYMLVVEDNGAGMPYEQLLRLEQKLRQPLEEQTSCGIWNVHQRLRYLFGPGSGLQLAISPLGGLQVTMIWREESEHGAIADRG
ncbi:HAMP domain-containing protein [Paenibacillus pinisoli]|uniref:HAMP domain-containing protein n=1 Tax=Paenibacillus pinisoli TaxID=1276110 RepID=A0A3A6PJ12_9BACL|nr:histidine kinase [Paenibacillus pinisoli]RJX41277.1 HAMP domain-containing protein [Paenibacillus pinisoli]